MREVVLVGHCGPDMFMLKNAIARALPDAEIKNVNSMDDLERQLGDAPDGSALLVNRVLDGSFPSTSGIDLIRTLAAHDTAPRAMLISNHDHAQTEAVDAGAQPGFGKSALFDSSTDERLRTLVS